MRKPRHQYPVYARGSMVAGIVAGAMYAGMAIVQYGLVRGTGPGEASAMSVAVCIWLPLYLAAIAFGLVSAVLSLVRTERPLTMAWIGVALCLLSLSWFVLPSILGSK